MRRRIGFPLAVALALGAIWALPAPVRAAPPHDVDLGHINLAGDGATAPRAGGEPASLTLDPGLQRAVLRLLARVRPAAAGVVVAEAATGRVLAFVEVAPKSGRRGDVLLSRMAPAASVFKLVTSAALIEIGQVSPKRSVCIDGGIRRIDRKHLEPPRSGPAICSAFRGALGHSRNAVYAQLVTRFLMRSDLISMGDRFGFNRPVPFDAARVPFGRLELPYNDLEFARAAAGFRGSTLSVLGGLELAAIVANGGRTLPLGILEPAPSSARPAGAPVIKPSTAAELRRMMEVTVHSGTSLEAFSRSSGRAHLPGIRVAGKTGTLKPDSADPTSSWFIGFAPSDKPEVIVSVLLQNGRVWRQRANEVARDVLRAHFAAQGRPGVTDPFSEE